MSTQNATDYRQMTADELVEAERRTREEIFELRFQQHTGQLSNTAKLAAARRSLARLLTVMGERQNG